MGIAIPIQFIYLITDGRSRQQQQLLLLGHERLSSGTQEHRACAYTSGLAARCVCISSQRTGSITTKGNSWWRERRDFEWSETEADKELEGWVAGILNRDGNGKMNLSKENLTQMMAEYEEMEEKRKADEAEASVKGEEWKKVFREAKEKAEKSDSKI